MTEKTYRLPEEHHLNVRDRKPESSTPWAEHQQLLTHFTSFCRSSCAVLRNIHLRSQRRSWWKWVQMLEKHQLCKCLLTLRRRRRAVSTAKGCERNLKAETNGANISFFSECRGHVKMVYWELEQSPEQTLENTRAFLSGWSDSIRFTEAVKCEGNRCQDRQSFLCQACSAVLLSDNHSYKSNKWPADPAKLISSPYLCPDLL